MFSLDQVCYNLNSNNKFNAWKKAHFNTPQQQAIRYEMFRPGHKRWKNFLVMIYLAWNDRYLSLKGNWEFSYFCDFSLFNLNHIHLKQIYNSLNFCILRGSKIPILGTFFKRLIAMKIYRIAIFDVMFS